MTTTIRVTDGVDVYESECVEYVRHCGNDMAIVDAARVSFDKGHEQYDDDANEKLIKYLASHNHWSPFAHCSVTFRVHAPIFLARQFIKHRAGFEWNEISRRYVDSSPLIWVPESWRKRPSSVKQGSTTDGAVPVEGQQLHRYKLWAETCLSMYRADCDLAGVCPEQARAKLPLATLTSWIWTGSVAAWARMVELRGDSQSQLECRPYTTAVEHFMGSLFPKTWSALSGKNLHVRTTDPTR